MDLIIDFKKDFVENLISELGDYSVSVPEPEDQEKVKLQFFNFKRRLIPKKRRKILRSKEFSCPQNLKNGLTLFEEKMIKGEDSYPHLSRNIKNLDYNDSLLNDWGIYHFHLGSTMEDDGFISRTGPVLFGRFDDNNFYFINVMDHGSWTKQEMIKVLHENWPTSISSWRLGDIIGLSHVPSDHDIHQGRKFGINQLVQIEPGVVYAPIGGGITTAKTSIEVSRAVMYYDKLVLNLENYIKDQSEQIMEQLRHQYSYSGDSLNFQLSIEGRNYGAIEMNTKVLIQLGEY